MKRLIIVSLMLLFVIALGFPQAKPGGIAREAAMGGSNSGNYLLLNPFVMEDPALILVNPAYQAMYKDYTWANTFYAREGYGKQNAGISFSINDVLNIGLDINHNPSAINGVGSMTQIYSGLPSVPQVQNVWELVGSHQMSNLTLGLGLMYGWSNYDSTFDTTESVYKYPTPPVELDPPFNNHPPYQYKTEASSQMFGIRIGANIDLYDGSYLDVSSSFKLDNAKNNIYNTPPITKRGGEYSASGTEFQIHSRAKLKVSDIFNFIPYGDFSVLSAKPKEDTPPIDTDPTASNLKLNSLTYALGLGTEYKTETFYLAGGLSWQYEYYKWEILFSQDTSTTTTRYIGLPVINIGGEWSFTEWLTGRMGYYRTIGSVNHKFQTPRRTDEWNLSLPSGADYMSDFRYAPSKGLVTFGIGLKFGGFALDATASGEAVERWFNKVGSKDLVNTFGYLTASYNFAE